MKVESYPAPQTPSALTPRTSLFSPGQPYYKRLTNPLAHCQETNGWPPQRHQEIYPKAHCQEPLDGPPAPPRVLGTPPESQWMALPASPKCQPQTAQSPKQQQEHSKGSSLRQAHSLIRIAMHHARPSFGLSQTTSCCRSGPSQHHCPQSCPSCPESIPDASLSR
jgi:hypothetical protein